MQLARSSHVWQGVQESPFAVCSSFPLNPVYSTHSVWWLPCDQLFVSSGPFSPSVGRIVKHHALSPGWMVGLLLHHAFKIEARSSRFFLVKCKG